MRPCYYSTLLVICFLFAPVGAERYIVLGQAPATNKKELEKKGEQIRAHCRALLTENKHEEALQSLREGLLLLDAHRELPAWVKLAFTQAEVQKLIGRRKEALDTYREIAQEKLEIDDLANLYNRMGAVFVESAMIDSAFKYIRLSEAMNDKAGHKDPRLDVWNWHLEGVALMNSDPVSAKQKLTKALNLAYTADPINVTILLCHLGELEKRAGNLAGAEDLYAKACNKAIADNAILNHLWALERLADVLHRRGLDSKAYHWMHIKDSLELFKHRAEIDRAVGDISSDLAVKRLERAKAETEKQKQVADTRTQLALVSLGFVVAVCVLLFRALTKVRRQRAELAKAHARLDAQAEGLSRQAQELEAANQHKNLLLGIIGHDVRSPLSNLRSTIGLMKDGALSDEEFSKLLGRMDNDLQEARSLLDDLLLWAKSQMNGLKVDIRPENLLPLVEEVLRQQKHVAADRDIHFTFHSTGAVFAQANPSLIKTILRNLVGNAIQHSSRGAEVSISVLTDGGSTRISVANSGSAMPAQDRETLTGRKRGVAPAHTSTNPNQGFGLVLVRDFLLVLNGHAEVELPASGGTIVHLVLPQAKGEVVPINLNGGEHLASA